MELVLLMIKVSLQRSNYFRIKLATVVTKPMPKCDEKESARSDKNVEIFTKTNDVLEIDFNQIGDVSELKRFKTATLNHAKEGLHKQEGVKKHIVKNRSTLFCIIYSSIWPNQFRTTSGKGRCVFLSVPLTLRK